MPLSLSDFSKYLWLPPRVPLSLAHSWVRPTSAGLVIPDSRKSMVGPASGCPRLDVWRDPSKTDHVDVVLVDVTIGIMPTFPQAISHATCA